MIKRAIDPKDFLLLVVDDIPLNLKVLRGILEPLGYQLTLASNGQQTLDQVKQKKPDLILLDLMMPDMDGLEVCQQIKSHPNYTDIAIIFLTASREQQDLVSAFEKGAVDYIVKPFNKSELLARIKTHLELKHYRDYLQQQAQQEKLMSQITQGILRYFQLDNILNTTVLGVRSLLEADRVVIARFLGKNQSKIVAESVQFQVKSILGENIKNCVWGEISPVSIENIGVKITHNIVEETLSPTSIELLKKWEVKSEVIFPLLQQDSLWGWLIIHQCQSLRKWKEEEINLLTQLTEQITLAIRQSELYHQLEIANKELQHLAHLDSLTQIPNRRQFDLSISQEWVKLWREKQPLSLILCDIDYFKQYNDFYGHPAGDICLQKIAQAISVSLKRPRDLVARYGGEEFGVILPNSSLTEAIEIALVIQKAIAQLQIAHLGVAPDYYVTLSMGISSVIPSNHSTVEQLISHADQCLYQAKVEGRNQYCFTLHS